MDYYILPASIHELLIARDDGLVTRRYLRKAFSRAIEHRKLSNLHPSSRIMSIAVLAKPNRSKSFDLKPLTAVVRGFYSSLARPAVV